MRLYTVYIHHTLYAAVFPSVYRKRHLPLEAYAAFLAPSPKDLPVGLADLLEYALLSFAFSPRMPIFSRLLWKLYGIQYVVHDHNQMVQSLKQRLEEILEIIKKQPGGAYEIAAGLTWSLRGKSWEQAPEKQKWFAVMNRL